MRLPIRELLVRLIGAILGVGSTINIARDVWTGLYNNHGTIIDRSSEPFAFWTHVMFEGFFAVFGFYLAVRGSGREWKS